MTKFDEAYFAELAAKEKGASDAQVVGEVDGKPVTRGELTIAFNAVADKANWKNPIDAMVSLDPHTKAMVAEAVKFFTGSKAKFTRVTGTTTGNVGIYRVRAAGYYKTIGA